MHKDTNELLVIAREYCDLIDSLDEVAAALTDEPDTIDRRYRDQFTRLTQRRLEAGRMCLDDACAIDLVR